MAVMNDIGKVLVGKDNFLFLGGADSNGLEQMFTGATTVEMNALRILKRNIEYRKKYISVPWLVVIVPEAHVIYPEKLPNWFHLTPYRPVHSVLPLFGDHAIYPERELLGAKYSGVQVYTGEDSHWTIQAASLVYRLARRRLSALEEFPEERTVLPHRERADLRTKLEPNYTSTFLGKDATPDELLLKERLCFFSGVPNHGAITVLRNPNRRTRVLLFGTSFSTLFSRPIHFDAGELVLVHSTGFDRAIYEAVQPDCVIFEMPERFIHRPTVDNATSSALVSLAIKGYGEATPLLRNDAQEQLDSRTRELVRGCMHAIGLGRAQAAGGNAQWGDADERGLLLFRRALPSASAEYLNRFVCTLREQKYLQPVWQGHYFSLASMATGFRAIDNAAIDFAQDPYPPDSEMGRLVRIRYLLKAGMREEARSTMLEFLRDFGVTDQALYYIKFLGLD